MSESVMDIKILDIQRKLNFNYGQAKGVHDLLQATRDEIADWLKEELKHPHPATDDRFTILYTKRIKDKIKELRKPREGK